MTITYYKINPGGNITALVPERDKMKNRVYLAKTILANDPSIEQVGFIVPPKDGGSARVEMAGDEFCGNAIRALAFLLYQEKGWSYLSIESSGYKQVISANFGDKKAAFSLDSGQFLYKKVEDGELISIPGITYLVVDKRIEKDKAKELLKKYNLLSLPASGVVVLERCNNNWNIRPIVWVRNIESFYEETACASGSLAAAFCLRQKGISGEYAFLQPSGSVFKVKFVDKNQIEVSGPIERALKREEKILI